MAAELPRCATCRVSIQPGQNVAFRTDGRVQHVDCPEVLCPVCARAVLPGEPIRRDDESLLHANCWMRRLRRAEGLPGATRPIAGGCTATPWSLVSGRVVDSRPAPDEVIWVTRQLHERAAHARDSARAARQARRPLTGDALSRIGLFS